MLSAAAVACTRPQLSTANHRLEEVSSHGALSAKLLATNGCWGGQVLSSAVHPTVSAPSAGE